MSDIKELLATLNEKRVAKGETPLASWKKGFKALQEAVASYDPPIEVKEVLADHDSSADTKVETPTSEAVEAITDVPSPVPDKKEESKDQVKRERGQLSKEIRSRKVKGESTGSIAKALNITYAHAYSVLHPWHIAKKAKKAKEAADSKKAATSDSVAETLPSKDGAIAESIGASA